VPEEHGFFVPAGGDMCNACVRTMRKLLVLAGLSSSLLTAQQLPSVSVEEVAQRIAAKDTAIVLLDVRTPAEHAAGALPGSVLIPVQELPERLSELKPFQGKQLIVYCRSGNRSARATALLREHGFNAWNMSGGILEWQRKGYPLAPPRR
jgi:rhodanese-related sulfurtransferase